jgi:hypothetical protein
MPSRRSGGLLPFVILMSAPSLLFGLGCRVPPPVVPQKVDEATYQKLRADVTTLTVPHCGSCHDKRLPTAKPEALAIFDYTVEDWPMMLKEDQISTFQRRLGSKLNNAGDAEVAKLFGAVLGKKEGPRPRQIGWAIVD